MKKTLKKLGEEINMTGDYIGTYIVLECHGGPEYAIVVTDEDGNNKVFTSYSEAKKEADQCQDGLVVEI